MKTNLDSLFKTDTKCEADGVWFNISNEIGFLVRRFGGANSPKVKVAMSRLYKPYARMIENDTMPESEQKKIMIKIFVDSSVIDWKGIEIDGKEAAFSSEAAIKLFENLPEVFDALMKYSSDYANFKEDVGNF
jgi:hypothetical protein